MMSIEYTPSAGNFIISGKEFLVIEPTDKPFTCQRAKTTALIRITDEHPQYKNVKDTQEGSLATFNSICYTVSKVSQCNTGNLEWIDIEMVEKEK